MASEALELVKTLYPPGGLDWAAVMADPASERRYMRKVEPLLHEDFEMFPAHSPGESRTTVVGVEAYAAALREVMGAFTRFRIVPESFVDLGERIVVIAALEGVMIEGSIEFSGTGGAIIEVQGGQIRRISEYDSRPALLAAADITEQEAEARGVPAETMADRGA